MGQAAQSGAGQRAARRATVAETAVLQQDSFQREMPDCTILMQSSIRHCVIGTTITLSTALQCEINEIPRLCWRCELLESITLPKKKKIALHKMKSLEKAKHQTSGKQQRKKFCVWCPTLTCLLLQYE